MGLGHKDLSTLEPEDSGLGSWTANVIFVNRHKCVIFVNDKTLFNFLVPDVLRKQIRELAMMLRGFLSCVLSEEGFSREQIDRMLEVYTEIGYSNTKSRSVLGSMNELAFLYKFCIQSKGGLHSPYFPKLIKEMNRMPMGSLGYKLPIEALLNFSGELPREQ